MNRLAPLRFARFASIMLIAAGCTSSKDTGNANNKMTAGSGAAGSSAAGSGGGSTAGSGGGTVGGRGSNKEGDICSVDNDCDWGLKCLIDGIDAGGQLLTVRICARACTSASMCDAGESCQTKTPDPGDAHCINTTSSALMPCGPGDTSDCATGLQCVFQSDGNGNTDIVGTCFTACKLPSSTMTLPSDVVTTCPDGQTCNDIGDPDVGLCAIAAARGAACDFQKGELCAPSDACVGASGTDSTCYQDCTATNMCDAGKTCTALQDGSGSICM